MKWFFQRKIIVFLVLLVSSGKAFPVGAILEEINEQTDNGYYFRYKTSDLQEREESGQLIITANGQKFFRIDGSYSYVIDGKKYSVSYSSDDKGYHAKVKFNSDNESSTLPPIGFEDSGIDLRISTAQLASLAGGGLG